MVMLVTGGAGFIGSHIVEALVQSGERVRVLDNLSTGSVHNLLPWLERIELMGGSICELEVCREAMKDVEVVFHQAALPSVQRSIEDPITTHMVNVMGTLNILIAARDAGVKRVVYASSSSVYGDTEVLPKHECLTPSPKSPYALSKLMGERLCQLFYQLYGLETVCLRYFNIYGPRQDPDSPYAAVIPRFVTALLNGMRPIIYGDGEQTRDFTYVADCVQANLKARDAEKAVGEVMNIACGAQTSVNQLLRILTTIVSNDDVTPLYEPARPGDVRHSYADITKAKQLLGYQPQFTLTEGLKRTVEWFAKRASL